VGPRIISYRFIGGENQLHEVEADTGQLGRSDFRLYGGHRLWVSPELESTYFPDNVPVEVSEQGNKVRFTAPVEESPPGKSLQKDFEVELASSGSEVSVIHRLTNHNRSAIQLAPWAPTMLRPGGKGILPLPPKAAMDKDHYQSVGRSRHVVVHRFGRLALGFWHRIHSTKPTLRTNRPVQRTDVRHL